MSSLTRRMQRKLSRQNATVGLGNKVGFKNENCLCCVARELRLSKRAAKKGGHVL